MVRGTGSTRVGWGNAVRRGITTLMSCQFGLAFEPGRQVASVIAESRSAGAHALLTAGGKGLGFRKILLGIGLGLCAAAGGLNTCGERIEYSRSRLGSMLAILVLRASHGDYLEE
jgi:hypothetical protein